MPIYFNTTEIQSNYDRVKFAEGLIQQLPKDHDGRNTWLMNYGRGDEAKAIREKNNIAWEPVTQSAVTRGGTPR